MKKIVTLSNIDLQASPRVREIVDGEIVEQYAQAYKDKEPMPHIVLMETPDGKLLLVDGRHRVEALLSIKAKMRECDVQKGDYAAALCAALLANRTHGLRRSNADKRRCVSSALKQWPNYSNSKLADVTGVDDHTIADVRKQLEGQGKIEATATRVGKDNREFRAEPTRKDRTIGGSRKSETPSPDEEEKPRVKAGANGFKDSTGFMIPIKLMPLWERSGEVNKVIGELLNVRAAVLQAQKKDDPLYAEVKLSTMSADLERISGNLRQAIPYAVCPTCQGHPELQPKNHCAMCKGRGLISKFLWDNTVPAELKRIRSKASK